MRFKYYEGSPSGLIWDTEVFCGKDHNRQLFAVGDFAGHVTSQGYWAVTGATGRRLLAHRVIWELLVGEIPAGMQIDHIDGDKTNNKRENLRLVTHELNMRNQVNKKAVDGKFGVTRWTICRSNGTSDDYWRARWKTLEGKCSGKMFNIRIHGEAGAKALAEDARAKAIASMNSEGAGYTEVHQ